MTSTLIQSSTEARQFTLLSISVIKQVAIVDPLTPVWAKKDAPFKVDSRSEEELLELYAEEFFIEEEATVEEEAEAQAALNVVFAAEKARSFGRNRVILAGLEFSVHSPVIIHEVEHVDQVSVCDEQQACRPYPAGTDILFDSATPDETGEELALRAIFDPKEFPALFMCPVKLVDEYPPSPELLDDGDDLRLYPTLVAAAPLHDPVSHMLDFHPHCNEAQEAASVYVPRPGRSLMRMPPSHESGSVSRRRDSLFLDDGNGPRNSSEVEYNRAISRITQGAFLPSIDHLSNIESRSAFITYDKDTKAAEPTTPPISNECRTGKCTCLVYHSDVHVRGSGSSSQYPTGESLFVLFDNIIDNDVFVVDNVLDAPKAAHPTQDKSSRMNQALPSVLHTRLPLATVFSPGASYDAIRSSYADYRARNQLMNKLFFDLADMVCAQPAAAADISDMAEEDICSSPIPQPTELTYLDADIQQHVGYTAFNTLCIELDDTETLPRIHHSQDDFDDDDSHLVEGVVEIGELFFSNSTADSEISSSQDVEPDVPVEICLYDDLYQLPLLTRTPPRSRSLNSMRSLSNFPKINNRRRHPRLAIAPQLSDIEEVSSNEDNLPSSSSSSGSFIDFADQRGFVQTLATRRTDFLDDEGSEDDGVVPQSAGSSVYSDSDSSRTSPVSAVQRLANRRANFLDDEDSDDDVVAQQSASSTESLHALLDDAISLFQPSSQLHS
ncbi:hypothetical protein CC86DRAFT_411897 [Ophiobolus disseminans]|uniref:Uncharacterized protein n=1 Tax=Ophiobolus disseminans TaxID=1469910 RepID=A0A6A6ZIR7_9PLEO|nr:hypothetical protein CC86DRAFT_411897 [Ophiobolus disseminans]